VSGRYHLSAFFSPLSYTASVSRSLRKALRSLLTLQKIAERTKTPLGYTPLALPVASVEGRLSTWAPPLNSLCLSPKALLWRVTEGMVGQEVYDELSKGVEQR
jgi:hypothetical protein